MQYSDEVRYDQAITPPPPNYTHHYYTAKGSWWLTTLVSPWNRPHGATRVPAGQNDQPAAAGQCASCKLQTTKPKACSNQL